MFEELVKNLFARGVIVTIEGRYDTRNERITYKAEVTNATHDLHKDDHTFTFTARGRYLDEIAEEINRRIAIVEPIIALGEKHQLRKDLVRKVDKLGDEIAILRGGNGRVDARTGGEWRG